MAGPTSSTFVPIAPHLFQPTAVKEQNFCLNTNTAPSPRKSNWTSGVHLGYIGCMATQAKLTGAERDFFHLVYAAGVANPFGHEREEIELKMAGLYPDATRTERTAAASEAVARHIALLEAENRADASRYEGDDQRLVRAA